MWQRKVGISIVYICCFGLQMLTAQEAITASGGNATGSGGSASYSLGQVAYTTNIGSNGIVMQGVQQPYEISVVNGIVNAKALRLEGKTKNTTNSPKQAEIVNNSAIELKCNAFPNPTIDLLTLYIEFYDKWNLSYRLFDVNGKLLESSNVVGSSTVISMRNYVSATYFLNIVQGNIQIKTFKIIKK